MVAATTVDGFGEDFGSRFGSEFLLGLLVVSASAFFKSDSAERPRIDQCGDFGLQERF